MSLNWGKPTRGLPGWASGFSGSLVITAPTTVKQALGWQINEAPPSSSFNWAMSLYYQWLKYLDEKVSAFVGTGADGDANYSSGTTTLGRDMFYDDLTISGGTFDTQGWAVYVKGRFTWSGGAIICNGTAGSNGAAGVGGAGGSSVARPFHTVGGKGGNTGVSGQTAPGSFVNLTGFTSAGSGAGSDVGSGGGSSAMSGDSGAFKKPPFIFGTVSTLGDTLQGVMRRLCGGASGGGGAGSSAHAGGGGGQGGGLITIIAREIVITGAPTASAVGAAGGNAETGAGAIGGGGGGGQGGGGLLVYGSLTGSPPAITVTGGAGGTGGTSGTAGAVGASAFAQQQMPT